MKIGNGKKIIWFYFCILLSLVNACSNKTNEKNINIISTRDFVISQQQDENVLATSQEDIDNQTTIVENQVEYNPVDVVDKTLANPSRKLNIALVVPMSGKYASIGVAMTEVAMLTTSKSFYENSGTIRVYNIGQLNEANWKQNQEVVRLLKDENDVIIGSVFKDTTEKLLSVIPDSIPYISFINDDMLTKKYPNLTTVGINNGFKIISLFQFLSDHKRQFVSLVFPATKKGYEEEKLFRKLAPEYQIFIVNSQFYQVGSKASMGVAIRGINKAFTATYIIDENGQLSTETYKQSKERKKQQQLKNSSTNLVKTQQVETNAIYIGANENDLIQMLGMLDQIGILNKNIDIFSDAIVDPEKTTNTNLDTVMYIGYNYNFINTFNQQFKKYFNHDPNYFGYMTYDIIAMLLYVANTGKMLPRNFYSEDGFRGTLDEFRFAREGNIERRFGIYKIKNGLVSREFIPDDYVNSWKTDIKNNSLYK